MIPYAQDTAASTVPNKTPDFPRTACVHIWNVYADRHDLEYVLFFN